MPPMKLWKERFPAKFAPLSHARLGVENESLALALPPENLISPEIVRKLCWSPPPGATTALMVAEVSSALVSFGARSWQASLVAPILAAALLEREPVVLVIEPDSPVIDPESAST